MNFWIKTSIVPGGYAAAFGDALTFIFVFGIAALPPTGLALHYLRPLQKFWRTLAAGAAWFISLRVSNLR